MCLDSLTIFCLMSLAFYNILSFSDPVLSDQFLGIYPLKKLLQLFSLKKCQNVSDHFRFLLEICLNPLNPKSDQSLISPHNNTSESHIRITRIKETITSLKKPLIIQQILLVSALVSVQRTIRRICKLMLGCKELRLVMVQHKTLKVNFIFSLPYIIFFLIQVHLEYSVMLRLE